MTDKSGGFYSSLDADSEGEEGKYYVWTKDEIDNLLKEKSEIFCDYFSITANGNWEENNILFITQKKEDLPSKYKLDEKTFENIINESKMILLDKRNERVKPDLTIKF